MTTTVRDPWSDARVAATQAFLEGDLAGLRRRLLLRRALGLILGAAAVLGGSSLVNRLIDPDVEGLWSAGLGVLWPSVVLIGLAVVLVTVGAAMTSGAARAFVAPEAFLTATDRAWLRTQLAQGRPVTEQRRAVVADAASRMVTEGRFIPTYLGLTLLYVAVILGGGSLGTLVLSSGLIAWMLVSVVRAAVWSGRARRWLGQYA